MISPRIEGVELAFSDVGRFPEDTTIVAGSGRGGTTWVGEVVARMLDSRVLFEPFLLDEDKQFVLARDQISVEKSSLLRNYPLYLPGRRAEDPHARRHLELERILQGRIQPNTWSDQVRMPDRTYRGRLIKDIRANLFLGYIAANWPEVRILLVTRSPLHAIDSQLDKAKRGWVWDWSPTDVVSQAALVEDWLAPHLDLMRREMML